ncbi:MAG: response regulator transcription factor [Anaerolineae bacterium]|nr:response regulator transcription factor [Anaerolineae bacterium]
MLRILVIADDLLARTGLTSLLETISDFDVIGQTNGGPQLVDDVEIYEPDILLYDLGWVPQNALVTLTALSELELPLLALLPTEDEFSQVMSAVTGFDNVGLILRDSTSDVLTNALAAVASGLTVFDGSFTLRGLADVPSSEQNFSDELTSREDEVLQLLAKGLTNKAIAHSLGITDHTVKFHVNAIMGKLSAQSRTEAVIQAARAGLIKL